VAASDVSTRVGSKLLFENSEVRVWDFTLEPGEWSDFHRHEHDYVIVYVTDAELGLQALDAPSQTSSVADGYVSHTSVGSAVDRRLTHRLGNLGAQGLRHLVIEILGTRPEQSTPMRVESNDPAEMPGET
jgi:beta-alanine degradation protein BauB